MGDASNEAAVNALHGIERYIHLGEWKNIEEQKIVVFKGAQQKSTCWVIDVEGNRRQVQGTETKEILVHPGERVYAMDAYIQFKSTTA
jgi:hypothetical protein